MQGVAAVGCTLLKHMPEELAFWAFTYMYTVAMRGIVTPSDQQFGWVAFKEQIRVLLKLACPALIEHLDCENADGPGLFDTLATCYMLQMALALFVDVVPGLPEQVANFICSQFFVEGPHTIFIACAAVFVSAKDKLLESHDIVNGSNAMQAACNSFSPAAMLELKRKLQAGGEQLIQEGLQQVQQDLAEREPRYVAAHKGFEACADGLR